MLDQQQLRSLIFKIQGDPSLTPIEKTRKTQELMMRNWVDSRGKEPKPTPEVPSESEHGPCYRSEGQLGCKHYARANKVKAPCCGGWYVCRLCHDEAQDHKMDRYQVKEMACMHCGLAQAAGPQCRRAGCGKSMARYHCGVCNLWDDDGSKKIYHCSDCGLCRIGEGLGKDYFHCTTCNVCMALTLQGRHKCIERNLESNCPICSEYMFTSTATIIFMRCGHCIHHCCYKRHIRSSYQCPICLKSLGNMEDYFKKIDLYVAQQPMPPEYKDSVSTILCNDCEQRSDVPFHFTYHKCLPCGSYNTKVIATRHTDALYSAINAHRG
eukprot:comp19837_c0_seq1/m.23890 comp19837_c0_seq1/g.23890  ORF comp19837_c0_seq1/g.23890 comp19837_c0_seq1/m.23890 type:complete len:324 (-) comp19837_c0_seq1:641-1612(-)